MPSDVTYGFWSYAHEDNELDGGNLLELARLIGEEYDLLSGEPLELFIDRDGIAWGEQWRKQIDSSLAQTTFFIPIITPRYFKRSECRRELLEFAAKAKGLGADELILPILYVQTPGLSAESSDHAKALVAETQYVDWRKARLLETSSREYRAAVSALAHRLLDIATRVAEGQISRELDVSSSEADAEGITDIVERITSLLSDWLDAVIGDKFNTGQFWAIQKTLAENVSRLQRSHSPASAIVATQMRFGREALPLVERFQREAQIYAARSIELDPLISTLARLVTEHPDMWSLVAPIREAIDEAMPTIRRQEQVDTQGIDDSVAPVFDSMRHLGRIFQKCGAITREAERMVDEGNSIVRRWDAELAIHPKP